MKSLVVALLLAALAVAPAGVQATPETGDAQSVISKMIDRDPSLKSYRTRVHVDVHMLNFPYLAPKLDGTTTYRRPDTYEVVFDHVPSYAKGFSRLFDDVGDPAAWNKDQNVTLDGTKSIDGRSLIVLRLTKKIHSTILDHTLAFIDPATYELQRMEWHYTSGGTITMTQAYRTENGHTLLASQHADIAIPHVHAVADATYAKYETNVAEL